MEKYDFNKNFFEVIDTQEKAYVLGFLYADGCNKTKLNFSKAKEGKHVCTMEYSGRKQVEKFYKYLYEGAFVYGSRKKEKFEEIICALDKKLSSETRLTAGTPEMVISNQDSKSL